MSNFSKIKMPQADVSMKPRNVNSRRRNAAKKAEELKKKNEQNAILKLLEDRNKQLNAKIFDLRSKRQYLEPVLQMITTGTDDRHVHQVPPGLQYISETPSGTMMDQMQTLPPHTSNSLSSANPHHHSTIPTSSSSSSWPSNFPDGGDSVDLSVLMQLSPCSPDELSMSEMAQRDAELFNRIENNLSQPITEEQLVQRLKAQKPEPQSPAFYGPENLSALDSAIKSLSRKEATNKTQASSNGGS